jgi:hypothetical protein
MLIDNVAAQFCEKLNEACGAENRKAFEAWTASNRVDNPNALGLQSRPTLPGQIPNRTFRYGMPDFRAARPTLTFAVSKNLSSCFRTPAEQAREVIIPPGKSSAKSYVCWGAHMSNMARHIIPTINGNSLVDGDTLERLLGPHLQWFIAIWKQKLQESRLKDAGGGVSWYKTPKFNDQLHVELPGAKIPQSDPRAKKCVLEYVRLVNSHQGRRNQAFEGKCEPVLSTILASITVP